MLQPTYSARPGDIERRWFVIDAEGVVLGRLATQLATILRGKHKPMYTPSMDTGDNIIVINASKVALTGKKLDDKFHYWHTGYQGGLKTISYRKFMAKDPAGVVRLAVRGMLPKTPLGRAVIKKLKVYPGDQHPHAAQNPEPLAVQAGAR